MLACKNSNWTAYKWENLDRCSLSFSFSPLFVAYINTENWHREQWLKL